jgi:hypothetical protein
MASGTTAISDVVVPAIFAPYVQQLTEQKSRLVRSGALTRDAALDAFLAGGGLTANEPSWKDLDNDVDNVSSDTAGTSSPNKIGTATEIQVRLSRNNSWASADLAAALAGSDPMNAIASRVSDYWVRRQQAAFVATLTGIFADNAAAPAGSEHVQNDLTWDVSGSSFTDGVTNFTAEAFVDACGTMGDSMDSIKLCMVHSVVFMRMLKNNLIDFIPDSTNTNAYPNAAPGQQGIPTFLGRVVIVDDGMPASGGVYETWLFGMGAVRLGVGSPRVPAEIFRLPSAGNGGGQEQLYSRLEWCLHPVGHKYAVASPASGGPSNAATTGNLAHLDSWMRVYPERKQIKIARLKTRES